VDMVEHRRAAIGVRDSVELDQTCHCG
jgi:hypothetical protein